MPNLLLLQEPEVALEYSPYDIWLSTSQESRFPSGGDSSSDVGLGMVGPDTTTSGTTIVVVDGGGIMSVAANAFRAVAAMKLAGATVTPTASGAKVAARPTFGGGQAGGLAAGTRVIVRATSGGSSAAISAAAGHAAFVQKIGGAAGSGMAVGQRTVTIARAAGSAARSTAGATERAFLVILLPGFNDPRTVIGATFTASDPTGQIRPAQLIGSTSPPSAPSRTFVVVRNAAQSIGGVSTPTLTEGTTRPTQSAGHVSG